MKMHNGELAKKFQVSPALTRKECLAKPGVTYLLSKCFATWMKTLLHCGFG